MAWLDSGKGVQARLRIATEVQEKAGISKQGLLHCAMWAETCGICQDEDDETGNSQGRCIICGAVRPGLFMCDAPRMGECNNEMPQILRHRCSTGCGRINQVRCGGRFCSFECATQHTLRAVGVHCTTAGPTMQRFCWRKGVNGFKDRKHTRGRGWQGFHFCNWRHLLEFLCRKPRMCSQHRDVQVGHVRNAWMS